METLRNLFIFVDTQLNSFHSKSLCQFGKYQTETFSFLFNYFAFKVTCGCTVHSLVRNKSTNIKCNLQLQTFLPIDVK